VAERLADSQVVLSSMQLVDYHHDLSVFSIHSDSTLACYVTCVVEEASLSELAKEPVPSLNQALYFTFLKKFS
jgi:hypothetical protein